MSNGKWNLALTAGVVVLMAAGGAWFFRSSRPAPVNAVPAPAPVPASPPPPPAEAIPVLEESDAWMRPKAAALSADPRFRSWILCDDLIARWVGAVNIAAAGRVPAESLSFLRPRKKFRTRERDGEIFVDSRSYDRYDGFAEAFATIDAGAAANLFHRARPLIDAAWSNLGETRGTVLVGLSRAEAELLSAPPAPARAGLRPCEKAINYCYVDDRLESRSSVQKQLMRMGPRNQALVQAKIRELARAFGVPEQTFR